MALTQSDSRRRDVSITVGRRVARTIGRLTAGHLAGRRRRGAFDPMLIIFTATLITALLWRDLPGLYQAHLGGGSDPYVTSPLTVPFRAMLGVILLTGIAVLVAPDMNRRSTRAHSRATVGLGCSNPADRAARPRHPRRRRGVDMHGPTIQPGRSAYGGRTLTRRAITRSQHTVLRARVANRHARATVSPCREVLDGGRPGSGTNSARQQRSDTVALTLITGYVALSVIAFGAALNAGVPTGEALRGFVVAVALALPPTVQILLRPQLSEPELPR